MCNLRKTLLYTGKPAACIALFQRKCTHNKISNLRLLWKQSHYGIPVARAYPGFVLLFRIFDSDLRFRTAREDPDLTIYGLGLSEQSRVTGLVLTQPEKHLSASRAAL